LGSDFRGNAFVPTEAKQTEIGLKYQPPGSSTMLSAALFQLDQTNVKTSDTQHLGYWTQSGKVRSRGVELQAAAELGRGLNLLANYAYLDNTLVKDATYEGRSLAQTPRHSASAWLDYRFAAGPLRGVQLGVGVRYLGSTWGNPSNTFKVPAVTLVDVAGNYELGLLSSALDGAMLSVNISNLGNKKYVASCTSEMYCFIGQDRVMTATLSYRW
jgi:iron complex outermembrane receptor protein